MLPSGAAAGPSVKTAPSKSFSSFGWAATTVAPSASRIPVAIRVDLIAITQEYRERSTPSISGDGAGWRRLVDPPLLTRRRFLTDHLGAFLQDAVVGTSDRSPDCAPVRTSPFLF